MKLDLGSGAIAAEGYEGVDHYSLGQEYVFDLWSGKRWPWRTSSVEGLRASHLIEHIEKGNLALIGEDSDWAHLPWAGQDYGWRMQDPLFFFFSEAWRVAAPGARFELAWPKWGTVFADMDPTHHRNIPVELLSYLSVDGRTQLGVSSYRVHSDWELDPSSLCEGLTQEGTPFETRATLIARKS